MDGVVWPGALFFFGVLVMVHSFVHEMARTPQASQMRQRLRQGHEADRAGVATRHMTIGGSDSPA